MSVTRDKNTGKWMAQVRIKDATGKSTHRKKRGFATKREAQEWEFGLKATAKHSLSIRFSDFTELYLTDMSSRIKASTMATKRTMVQKQILWILSRSTKKGTSARRCLCLYLSV